MVKLLLVIVIILLLAALSYSKLTEEPVKVPGTDTTVSSPADSIDRAGDAVQQSQNVQDKLKQEAQNQLNQ